MVRVEERGQVMILLERGVGNLVSMGKGLRGRRKLLVLLE